MDRFFVERVGDRGFLVSDKQGLDGKKIAAFTGAGDLIDWIDRELDANMLDRDQEFQEYPDHLDLNYFDPDMPGHKDDGISFPSSAPPFVADKEPDSDNEPESIGTVAKRVVERAGAGPSEKPERVEVADLRDDERGSPEIAPPLEGRSFSDIVMTFASLLRDKGAGCQWVKMTYAAIADGLDVPETVVKAIVDEAKNEHGLRVCRVMAGSNKGNNFTFSKGLKVPGVEPEKPVNLSAENVVPIVKAPAALAVPCKPDASDLKANLDVAKAAATNIEKVMGFMSAIIAKHGNDGVQISEQFVAKKVGIAADKLRMHLKTLVLAKRLIADVRVKGHDPFYSLPVPEEYK